MKEGKLGLLDQLLEIGLMACHLIVQYPEWAHEFVDVCYNFCQSMEWQLNVEDGESD